MTLSQRIALAAITRTEQQGHGYCPLCLNTGHKPGTCLLSTSK